MKKSKKDLYRFLGAEKFQKIVFEVEKLKYEIIEKFFPNIKETQERVSNKRFQKRLKNESVENQQYLLAEYQNQKLAFRKELVYKQNRNYHYNANCPTKFIHYLEWNKKVHINGMKKDIIWLLGILISTILLGNPMPLVSILLAFINTVHLLIDFECVNLQNYNLYRFQDKKLYAKLEKLEEKNQLDNFEKLGESVVSVSKAITKQVELPNVAQVVDEIETIEQTRKLLEYVKEQYESMKKNGEERRR